MLPKTKAVQQVNRTLSTWPWLVLCALHLENPFQAPECYSHWREELTVSVWHFRLFGRLLTMSQGMWDFYPRQMAPVSTAEVKLTLTHYWNSSQAVHIWMSKTELLIFFIVDFLCTYRWAISWVPPAVHIWPFGSLKDGRTSGGWAAGVAEAAVWLGEITVLCRKPVPPTPL